MPNIRIRLFRKTSIEDWEMDCFVLPNDETNGELVDHRLKIALDFKGKKEHGLFENLDNLLEHIPAKTEESNTFVKMVIGRLKNDKRTFWSFRSVEEYPVDSPETKIWAFANSVFEKRLAEKKEESSKCPFKVGDAVRFTPSLKTQNSHKNVEQSFGFKNDEKVKIKEIRGGIYLYFEDGRGGYSWNEFSPV